jgi:uncharacterized protein DUF4158
MLRWIAEQVGADSCALQRYAERDQTRREHFIELLNGYGWRSLGLHEYREISVCGHRPYIIATTPPVIDLFPSLPRKSACCWPLPPRPRITGKKFCFRRQIEIGLKTKPVISLKPVVSSTSASSGRWKDKDRPCFSPWKLAPTQSRNKRCSLSAIKGSGTIQTKAQVQFTFYAGRYR